MLLVVARAGPLFDDGGWFGATLLVVTVVVTAARRHRHLAARTAVPRPGGPGAARCSPSLVSRFTDDEAPWDFVPTPDALDALRVVFADGHGRHRPLRAARARHRGAQRPSSRSASAAWRSSSSCCRSSLRLPTVAGHPARRALRRPVVRARRTASPWWAFVAVAVGWLVLLVADERLNLVAWGRMLRRQDSELDAPRRWPGCRPRPPSASAPSPSCISLALPVLVPGLADAVIGRVTGSGGGEGGGDGAAARRSRTRSRIDPFVVAAPRPAQQPADVTVLRYRTVGGSDGYLRARGHRGLRRRDLEARTSSPPTPPCRSPTAALATVIARRRDPRAARVRYDFTADRLVSRATCRRPENLTEVRGEGEWYVDSATSTRVRRRRRATTHGGRSWVAVGDDVQPTADAARRRAGHPRAAAAPTSSAARRSRPRIAETGAPAHRSARRRNARGRRRHPGLVPRRLHLQHQRDLRADRPAVVVLPRAVPARQGRLLRAVRRHDGADGRARSASRRASSSASPAGTQNDQGELGRHGQGRARLARAVLHRHRLGALRADPARRGRRRHRHRADTGRAPGARAGPTSATPTREGVPNNRQVPEDDAGTPNAIAEVAGRPAPVDHRRPVARARLVGLLAGRRRRRCWCPPRWRLLRRRRRLSRRPRASRTPGASCATPRATSASPWSDAHTPRQAVAARHPPPVAARRGGRGHHPARSRDRAGALRPDPARGARASPTTSATVRGALLAPGRVEGPAPGACSCPRRCGAPLPDAGRPDRRSLTVRPVRT